MKQKVFRRKQNRDCEEKLDMIHPCQHMKIIMDKVGQFPLGWLERDRQDNWSICPIQVGSKQKGKDITATATNKPSNTD